MADTQTIKGLDDVLQKLKALPPMLASRNGGIVGRALRKGANVIKRKAQANVLANARQDDDYQNVGLLAKSIVVSRSKNTLGFNERYVLRVKAAKYQNQASVNAVGRWLEFGTEKQTAKPFMTPAYYSGRQSALDAIVRDSSAGIDRAIKRMGRVSQSR